MQSTQKRHGAGSIWFAFRLLLFVALRLLVCSTLWLLMILVTHPSPAQAGMKSATKAYEHGDYGTAYREFSLLARKGNPVAQRMLGNLFEAGAGVCRDYSQAFKWYLMAAQKGDAIAQFMTGQMYYEGKGGPRDTREAAHWFRKAAEKGLTAAQHNLGVLYEYGRGVPQNWSEASKWYRRAAELGVAQSQCRVGLMYMEGEGVPPDEVQAYLWLSLAAAQGDEKAARFRDALALTMPPDQIARAQHQARHWKPANKRGRPTIKQDSNPS